MAAFFMYCGNRENGIRSVSYTHLDVYKRQPDSCRDALLRTRRPGDVLPGGKRLSHLLKEQGVPRCIRDALGVIVRGNRVLAVQHVWYSMELDGCFPKFTGGVIKD